MTRKLTFLILALFALIAGPGWGQTYEKVMELDMTTKDAGTSAYNTTTTYGDWEIVYGANNNKGWAYFKMGGKSTTISTYNPCYIYSTIAATKQIDKITVSLPSGSLSKSGMKVNSWGVYVYSDSNMATQIDYVAGGTITNSAKTFDFYPSAGITWASGYYYKVSWDLANTTSTNGIVCVDKITLYKESTPSTDPSITVNPTSIDLGTVNINEEAEATFTVSQANLTNGITLSAENGNLDPESIVASAGDTEVTYTITPNAAGEFSDVITISCTDLENDIEINVSGNAIDPSVVETYEKITSAPANWEGEYLLVYENGNEADVWTGIDAQNCYVTASINNNSIEKPQGAVSIIISAMEGGYSIKVNDGTNNGKFISGTSGSNTLNFGNEAVLNTLSYTEGSTMITSNTSVMRFNSATNNLRFRYFKSTSYSSQQPVQLYKKINSSTVATPTFTPAGGTYATAQNVTISCATEGASIYYTLDGTTPTDASTLYTSAIAVSETTTVKAIAYSQTGETSSVASATYTIAAPLTTMDAIFAKATAVGATATDVTVTFNNWVISGVKDNNAYLTDNNGKGLIIYTSSHGFEVGDKLTGTAACKVQLYRGAAELTTLTSLTDGLTVTEGGSVTAQEFNINDLSGINTGAIITVNNVTYSGSDNIFTDDDENEIKAYNTFMTLPLFTSGRQYNITGVYIQYDETKEIAPRSADDIEETISTEQVETPTFSLEAGTYCGEQTVTISTLTGGATIHYTTDGTDPTASSSVYSSAITVDENMTIKAIAVKEGMDDSEIASAAYVINEPHSIDYSECANGSISGRANACEGETVEVTATPAQGYMLGTISVNGEDITGTTFTMPDENVTVSATFEVAPLMVTWDLTVVSYDANPTTELIQWSNDVVIMKNERNGLNNTAVNNYIPTGQSSTRFYKNNKLSIIPTDGYIISSVVFNAKSESYATALANSTWTNATASANGETVTITPTNGTQTISATIGGTCGFSAVTVYYQVNSEPSIEVVETLDLLFTESEGTIEATYLNIDFENIDINLYDDADCTTDFTGDWFIADFAENHNIEYYALENTVAEERMVYIQIYALGTDNVNDITKVIAVTQAPAAEKYTVTIANIQHGEIISIYDKYAEGATVQLMVEPAANYGLTSWSITKDADESDTEIVPVYNSEDGVYEFTMPAYDITVSATFENVVTYTRINSIDDLIVSKHYIIVGKDNGTYYAMDSQNDNNRTAIKIEATEAKAQVPTSISLHEFTISGDETNNYTFYDLDAPGFLYAASSSKNYLKTEETLDDNGKWTIEIDEETGEANIVALGNNTRNTMQYNSGSDLFSCYGSASQSPVYLYMKENDIDNNIYSDTYIDGDISNCLFFSVNKGAVLTVTGTIDASIMMFSIVDGSQLIYNDDIPNGMIANRFRKYADNEADQRTAWNLVSVPVKNFNLLPVPGISIRGDYDLFSYNEPTHFWKNKENEAVLYEGSYYIQTTVGTGYLFAMPSSNTQALLGGMGTLQGSGQDLSFPLSYTETLEGGETNVLKGFNLVGNPFTCNAYVDMEYMVLDEETGSTFIPGDIIKSGDAILVQATAEGQEITFTRNAPTKTENRLDISVSQNRGSIIDNARIRFSGNRFMNKFYLNESSARLYIPQNGEEFAIVSTSSTSGEMPLNFHAEKNGTYTITVNTKNVDAEYLHLIDNMTGMDVDLLSTPSYTFEAKTTDYASRFKLVFGVNNTASESSDSNFAYMSDGNLVISDIEGEATLQIIDELGRIISTETVSGSYNKALNLKAGLYILNLNGMTQKIVVE